MSISGDIEKKGMPGVESDVVSVERRAQEEGVNSIYDMKSELGASSYSVYSGSFS
jgi:hypothetical protein